MNDYAEATKELRRADGDPAAAKEALIKRSDREPDLARALLARGAHESVEWAKRQANARAFSPAAAAAHEARCKAPDAGGARIRSAVAVLGLLDTVRLASGALLGDARREDLRAQADFHRENELGNARRRAFYEALGRRVGSGRTVRQSVSEEAVRRLAKKHGAY